MTAFMVVGVGFVLLLLAAGFLDAFSEDDVPDDPEADEDDA